MRPGSRGTVEDLVGPGVMQMAHGAPGAMVPVVAVGLLPMAGRRWIDGNIDGELAEKFSVRVEDLDASIAAVRDVNAIVRINRDAVRSVELSD